MKDAECVDFLQRHLPRLSLHWPGFRRVHKQVCKRLGRRIKALDLSGLWAYEGHLATHPEEWRVFDSICQIHISRFYRDREVFDELRLRLLPSLAENVKANGGKEVLCWSAGCCAGEEPYTVQIIWRASVLPAAHFDLPLRIIATDTDQSLLDRALRGRYPKSSFRDLPEELAQEAFERSGEYYVVRKRFTKDIVFVRQDIREELPGERPHLILCRNLVFTYFDETLRREIFQRMSEKLVSGGFLVIGIHEALPRIEQDLVPHGKVRGIYQKASR